VGHCCVFFHAHPDDESLLTAGTMARLAAEGHRVVLVVATSGEFGLTETDPGGTSEQVGPGALGERRRAEALRSADALGCARVVFLGYGDSGLAGDRPSSFVRADVEEAAAALAAVLREERAVLLTTYDPSGGYGHPDHIRAHHVGARAAELAGTPLVLQATVDRDLLRRAVRLLRLVYPLPLPVDAFDHAYAPGRSITHRVNVRRYADAKRRSMAAHVSQTTGGESERTLAGLLRLPRWLFRWALGTEWYVQPGLTPRRPVRDPLATLKPPVDPRVGPQAGPRAGRR
jgi:LmbE family N-acetylglucosaminyl deacetylase